MPEEVHAAVGQLAAHDLARVVTGGSSPPGRTGSLGNSVVKAPFVGAAGSLESPVPSGPFLGTDAEVVEAHGCGPCPKGVRVSSVPPLEPPRAVWSPPACSGVLPPSETRQRGPFALVAQPAQSARLRTVRSQVEILPRVLLHGP